jgi:acyl-CoA synthetase (AMP-forming)/AMP-acid ligase II
MTTIGDLVERASRRFAQRVAVVDGERSLTFSEVHERSSRLANALNGLGAAPGARVALLMSNRLEFVEADFGIAKAGMVKAPMNPRLADDERRHVLANCAAEILLTESHERERIAALQSELPALKHVIAVDREDYADLLRNARPGAADLDIDPNSPSMILHTSGTTGRPKGATTSQRARIAATTHMLLDEFAARPDDGMVHVAPMSHGSGSKILAFYLRGARNVTLGKFSPDAFFDALANGASSSFVVPTMIRMLLDAQGRAKADLSRLRNLTYGGAPMPAALAEEAIEAFGPILTQVYGSCEAPHPVLVLSSADHVVGQYARLSSAGHETLGVDVRIVAADGTDAALGEPGELLIRGPNVMDGYWGDPQATAAVFTDGWYRSGDLAVRAEDGFVSIVGRERDLLISGGLNVYPAEVEAVIHRHGGVLEAAVFGVPDDTWGEAVAVAIVRRPGTSTQAEEIIAHSKAHLADYKKPRRVFFVDQLPKGPTGKVAKQELAARFAGPHD